MNTYKIIYQTTDQKETLLQKSFTFSAKTPLEFLLNANFSCQKNFVRSTKDIVSITQVQPLGDKLDRNNVIEQAKKLINGDREQTYGDPLLSHDRIGRGWEAILGIKDISASTVALMMSWLKISRIVSNKKQKDSYVDAIGYMALAFECQTIDQEKKEKEDGYNNYSTRREGAEKTSGD